MRHGVLSDYSGMTATCHTCCQEVRLRLLGSQEVRDHSTQHVHNLTTYNSSGLPAAGGLMDPHLGAEGDVMCKTCMNSSRNGLCMGHEGHIDLQVNSIHPMHQRAIVKMLKCSCFACGTFLLKPEHDILLRGNTPSGRLKVAADKCSRRAFCPNPECRLPCQPEFKADGRLAIKAVGKQKRRS